MAHLYLPRNMFWTSFSWSLNCTTRKKWHASAINKQISGDLYKMSSNDMPDILMWRSECPSLLLLPFPFLKLSIVVIWGYTCTPALIHPHSHNHTHAPVLTHSYTRISRIQMRKNLIDKSMFTAFFLFPLPCEPCQNRKICLYVAQNTGEFLTILHIVRVNHFLSYAICIA